MIATMLLASLPTLAAAPPARLEVALTPRQITVGDRVTAVLTLDLPAARLEGEPLFPDWGDRWGDAEVLAVEVPERLRRDDSVATFRQRVELAAFRPGEVKLPQRAVEVPVVGGTTGVTTPQDLSFTVVSVLPPAPEPGSPGLEDQPPLTPRPDAPPRTLPLGAGFWWTAAVGSGACLVLGLLVWHRSRQPTPASSSRLAPLTELQTALRGLSGSTPGLEGHVLLSRALRRYLGRELGFPAPESSTTEIRRSLNARPLPQGVVEAVTEVLSACDLAKFARQPVAGADVAQRAEVVRRIGRALDLHLNPPQPAEAAPGASEGSR